MSMTETTRGPIRRRYARRLAPILAASLAAIAALLVPGSAAAANSDPKKAPRVKVIDGAVEGGSAEEYADPQSGYWSRTADELASAGGSPPQVQVVWLKETLKHPNFAFPTDVNLLRQDLVSIV